MLDILRCVNMLRLRLSEKVFPVKENTEFLEIFFEIYTYVLKFLILLKTYY